MDAGYVFDGSFSLAQGRATERRERLRQVGVRFVIGFFDESVHYFVLFGLALVGLGVYLELESTSSQKQTFAALVFLFGAWWLLTPVWMLAKPRVKVWWKTRQNR